MQDGFARSFPEFAGVRGPHGRTDQARDLDIDRAPSRAGISRSFGERGDEREAGPAGYQDPKTARYPAAITLRRTEGVAGGDVALRRRRAIGRRPRGRRGAGRVSRATASRCCAGRPLSQARARPCCRPPATRPTHPTACAVARHEAQRLHRLSRGERGSALHRPYFLAMLRRSPRRNRRQWPAAGLRHRVDAADAISSSTMGPWPRRRRAAALPAGDDRLPQSLGGWVMPTVIHGRRCPAIRRCATADLDNVAAGESPQLLIDRGAHHMRRSPDRRTCAGQIAHGYRPRCRRRVRRG